MNYYLFQKKFLVILLFSISIFSVKYTQAEGNIEGIWRPQRDISQILPVNPPFTLAGRTAQDEFDIANDPYLRCIVYMPRAMIAWAPTSIEIIQSEERIWILFEAYHQVRRIFMDGRNVPTGVGSTWMGHSNGQWEDETLVVKTYGLRGVSYFWEGLPLSESTEIIEKFTRLDDKTLQIEMTITDPIHYNEPWHTTHIWGLSPDAHFYEYECDQVPK